MRAACDLTPAGESLLHHARSVLFGLEKMQGELSEYADGVRGHVRVHASISAIVQFLPEDLGAFIASPSPASRSTWRNT
jgi:DNA-binding transcriptional LysR family regulator